MLTAGCAVTDALLGGRRGGAVASGLALLAGSVCTRFGVFAAGNASAEDPGYTVVSQRERLGEASWNSTSRRRS